MPDLNQYAIRTQLMLPKPGKLLPKRFDIPNYDSSLFPHQRAVKLYDALVSSPQGPLYFEEIDQLSQIYVALLNLPIEELLQDQSLTSKEQAFSGFSQPIYDPDYFDAELEERIVTLGKHIRNNADINQILNLREMLIEYTDEVPEDMNDQLTNKLKTYVEKTIAYLERQIVGEFKIQGRNVSERDLIEHYSAIVGMCRPEADQFALRFSKEAGLEKKFKFGAYELNKGLLGLIEKKLGLSPDINILSGFRDKADSLYTSFSDKALYRSTLDANLPIRRRVEGVRDNLDKGLNQIKKEKEKKRLKEEGEKIRKRKTKDFLIDAGLTVTLLGTAGAIYYFFGDELREAYNLVMETIQNIDINIPGIR